MSGSDPVVIVTGPPGVGKTRTARLVARRRDRAVHLQSDRFFHFIEPDGRSAEGTADALARRLADGVLLT
ncbi:MAG TPA: AAA family ATPase [Solirubrobacteraceae bacterium]|nr:AAA family ATPase [Solirubrobacteraceae bacterium]